MAELSPEAFGFKPAGKSTKELDPSAFGFGSPTTEAVTPTAADYLKGIASGVGSLASGVGYLAEVAGANQVGRAIRGIGDTTQRYWQESMTPAGQRAAQSRVFEDDPGAAVPVKLGDRWGQALAMGAAQSAPSMLAAAIPGGIAAAGLRGAAGMAASRGIGGALAPLAAGSAAPIGGWATNFAGNLAARVPTALGFGAAEGAVAGATNAAQWKSDIEQKPLAELRNMPGFAALESQVGEQAARQQIAEQGASDIMRNTTLATGGIGALTGGGALGSAFQRVTTGAKGGVLGAIGRDAAKEAAQEIPQSGGERAIQNIATRDYLDPSQPITQGVLADALSGGAIGSVTGGVMGGGSHLSKGPLQKAAEASAATVPPAGTQNEWQGIPQSIPQGIPQSIPQEGGVPPAAGSTAGQTPAAVARADTSVLDVARAAAEDLETADTTSEGFRQTAEGLRKLPQQPNTPVAPGISPVPVSTAAPSLPSNQAESAGVPKPPQQGEKPSGPQAEIAQPAAPGQQAQPAAVFGAAGTVGNTGTQPAPVPANTGTQPAPVPANTGTQPVQAPANTGTQPAKAADSAEAEREWRDFVASEGRDIGPRQLAVIREQFMRRQMMNAAIEAATGRVEDARQREVAANRMAILDSLPLTTTGNTIRRFAASLRDAGIRDSRVSPEERQLIARRIAARDTLQHLEQVPPNELTLPEKQVKQAQPTMPRIESLRRRAAMPGVRIVGNRMLDRHGKRLATLSDDEAAELLPKPKPAPARTVEDTELADFIKSESADLGKRRLTLRALQAIRRQKQAEADKTDLEDLIEAERADLRERFAKLQDAQAAARARKPFVIPPLTTPAQPTTTRVMEQKASDLPLGKYGKAEPVGSADKLPAADQPAPAVVREFDSVSGQKQDAKRAAAKPAPASAQTEPTSNASELPAAEASTDNTQAAEPLKKPEELPAEQDSETPTDVAPSEQPSSAPQSKTDDDVAEQLASFEAGNYGAPRRISANLSSKSAIAIADKANADRRATYDKTAKQFLEGPLTAAPPKPSSSASDRIQTENLENVEPRPVGRNVVAAKTFAAKFKAMLDIAGNKDVRFYLNGVHIEDGGRMVATDGSRMAIVDGVDVSSAPKKPEEYPGIAYTVLGRDGQWIDGKFVDYMRAFPDISGQPSFTVDAQKLGDYARGITKASRYTDAGMGRDRVAKGDFRFAEQPDVVFSSTYISDAADLFRRLGYQQIEVTVFGPETGKPMALYSPDGKVKQAVMPRRASSWVPLFKAFGAGEVKAESSPSVPAKKTGETKDGEEGSVILYSGALSASASSPSDRAIFSMAAEADAKAAAEKEAKARQDAERARKDAEDRAEIKRRSEAAAQSFELGGDAMANLSGQSDMFGAPPPAAVPSREPASNAGELPAAEASPDKTPAAEPLEKPEELPAAVAPESASLPIVEHVTAKGKTLRGTIRTDLTLDQARALDKYTFRKDGGYFIREAQTAGVAAAQEAQDSAPASKPDKSKQQAERLRSTGEKLIESAQEAMNRDRLTNTARRARMASGAEAKAAQDKLIGETMLRIADAIEDGRAEHLAGVTSRAQIEQLDSIMQMAIYRADDKAGGYALTQKNNGRPFSDADLAFVAMPGTGQWISGARKGLLDGIAGKRGAPELRAEILRATEYTAEIHAKAKALLSDAEIKSAVGWAVFEGIERAARLARAGITNTDQLRKAITEYAQIRAAKTEGNKAKALERALIGQKVGVDFFPTPSAVAADMVRRADIKPGMRVLEPSAGNGNIAEAIQAAGVAPDVIEVSSSLREILDAKGFNLVGNDFMEASGQQYDRIVMNPPFSSRMDAEHVQHAYSLLKPGGKIVAIMGEGVFFGADAKAVKFREWLDSVGGTSEKLPQGTFADRTLMATTGVNSRIVEISKPDDVRFNIGVGTASSPSDRAIFSMAAEGKPADEILSFISKSSRRPFNRVLADALRRAGIVSSVTLDTASRFGKQQGAARYAAAYNARTDTVALFTPRDAERHILHELVHAATMKAIAGKGAAAVRMRALFLHVQKSGSLDGQYGMSNVDEFVAEAFSNPRFQDALKGIPAPKGSTLTSAWQWFVRIVARIVGIKTQPLETALDRALTVGAQLMRENAAVMAASGDTRYAIAWHGTPHVWPPEPGFPHGRPRLDKMGTGEGAQAYGLGWYSAEAQDVAKSYQTTLTFDRGFDFDGKSGLTREQVQDLVNAREGKKYLDGVSLPSGVADRVIDDIVYGSNGKPLPRQYKPGSERAALYQKLINEIRHTDSGSLYQLDIPDDVMPTLLDWDKPLIRQSAAVREALLPIINRSHEWSKTARWPKDQTPQASDLENVSGEMLLKHLRANNPEGKPIEHVLRDAGIPGLRYLDGSSRSKGAGTYNYVIWDQKVLDRIALLERNGEKLDAIRAADEVRLSLDAGQPFDGPEVAATPLKPGATTLMVDGIKRPAMNSNGKPIHWSEEGIRNFWRWFSGSNVVDAQGRPMVVYHGTTADFSKFDKEKIESEGAFFFTDNPDHAAIYAGDDADDNGRIMPMYVAINNPDYSDAMAWNMGDTPTTRTLKRRGHDGFVIENQEAGTTFASFAAGQAKSATGNSGSFSPTDPDIRFNIATDWQQSPVAQEVAKAFQYAAKSDAALSWLNPVQTQYHKAERLAQQGKFGFKRVFDLGQKFLSDIARFAVMAENSAPTLFHQIRSLADAKQAADAALRGDFGQQRNADIRAIAAPLYEGTLYGGGNPMAGMVWSDAQLRSRFGLTDRQIVLYHEAREAVKVSMDEMAKSLIARHAKREKVAADTSGSLQDVAEGVRDTLTLRADVLADEAKAKHDDTMQQVEDLRNAGGQDRRAKDMQKEADAKLDSQKAEVARIRATVEDVQAIADKAQKLQDAGYFPLMRFGRHTVTARDAAGKVKHFSMHDGIPLVPRSGQAQANRLADALREEHPDWDVTTGLMNPEKYKLYQGMNVDALQLFADHLDDETRQTYQEIIRLATNERAALRRMLTREGTPGFDRDVRRTLASFILSNARYTSSSYHLADMAKAAEQAEEDGGDVGAEAVKLYEYVTKPQEEAAKLRGFLFFNFLGGSLAAAMVNATQVPMMTFPRLAQYEDAGKLAARLARAAKVAVQNPEDVQGDVGAALRRAEEDGITAPHQIYEMTATAANNVFSGSRAGSAILRAWGKPFALAESFNRRTTFVAAFQIGRGMTVNQLRDAGVSTAFEFAEKVVQETQGIYNRGNRVNIGRGAIRATVMTFRQFSIMYLEMFSRLPPKQKAIMAGMLILAAGAGGLPFAEDIEDIIDTIGQWLGYRTNTRRTIRRGLSSFAGQRAADIAMNGVLSQMGVDLHSRLGLHNILPGTALLKPSTTDKGREFQDLLGPAASVVAAMGQALQDLATGRPDKAALAMAPVAVQNAVKGIKMAATGRAEDARGKPTIPVSLSEAGAKAIGFNPKSVADYGAVKRASTQDDRLLDVMRERFTSAIVDAIVANDQEAKDEAFRQVLEWNRQNPDARIDINPAAIRKRVRDMRSDGPSRVLKSLSPSLRQQARQEFANAQ